MTIPECRTFRRSRLPWLAIAIFLYLTATAFAAGATPPPDQDAPAWLQALYAALTSKNWGLVVGLALIAVVYPLRRFGPLYFKSQTGGLILAFAISLAGTFGAALAVGAKPDLVFVVTALTTAATAAGVWEWLKAHLPGAQAAADKATKPVQPPGGVVNVSILGLLIVVMAGSVPGAGCVASPPVVAAGEIVIDCVSGDGAKIGDLVAKLWAAIASGGSWTAVEQQAVASGQAIGGCALAEVVQRYLAPPPGRAAPDPESGRQARATLEHFRVVYARSATFHTPAGNL